MLKKEIFVNQNSNPYAWEDSAGYSIAAADATTEARAKFVTNVYSHLFVAVAACTVLTTVFMSTPAVGQMLGQLLSIRFGSLILILGFMAINWLASSWAHNAPSKGIQYVGLGLCVTAHAVLFTLLLTIAERVAPGVSQTAGILSLAIFATLTFVVWFTGANFNFLAPILSAGMMAVLVLIVLGFFMPIKLGMWFTGAMLVMASGYILYDTSRIMREYPTHAYVGAALELFTGVAMLFWYVVRLLMQLKDGD
jgi:hypothetical protein